LTIQLGVARPSSGAITSGGGVRNTPPSSKFAGGGSLLLPELGVGGGPAGDGPSNMSTVVAPASASGMRIKSKRRMTIVSRANPVLDRSSGFARCAP
jgi:hypothetical protein